MSNFGFDPGPSMPPLDLVELLKKAELSKAISEASNADVKLPFGGLTMNGGPEPTTDVPPRPQAGTPYTPMPPQGPAPAVSPAAPAQPPPMPEQDQRGLLAKMLNLGPGTSSALSAIGELGAGMSQHTPNDPGAPARMYQQQEAQNKTFQALVSKGVDPKMAAAAMQNPAVLQTMLGDIYKPKTQVLKEGDRIVTGDPENPRSLKDVTPGGGDPQGKTLQGRMTLAPSFGMKPGTTEYNAYVLNGKLPDVVPDHAAIRAADDKVMASKKLIEDLSEAKRLSSTAYSGLLANQRAGAMNAFGGSNESNDTAVFENIIQNSILPGLKSTFGARITNADLALVKSLQGAASQPPAVRDDIIQRAIDRAKQGVTQAQQDAAQLRGGSYYKPGGGAASSSGEIDLGGGYTMRQVK